jgi:hypothetical protein
MLRSARRVWRVGGSILGVFTVVSAMAFTALRADVPAATGDWTNLSVAAADGGGAEFLADKAGGRPDYLDRVVIARMYQNGNWTIPAAQDFTPERKIEYVCKALAYLKPSYVSGLVRLDWRKDSPHLDQQVKVFTGVRDCVRREVNKDVKFDIALNALHYTDSGEGVSDAKAGTERMRERLRSAQAAFHPDGWFFDFYANLYKDDKYGSRRFSEPLENGITWIHDTKDHKPRQFVGGTIWGLDHKLPPHSDFFAVTDRGGPDYTENLVKGLQREHQHTPILMHIDNDPEHEDSKSSKFWRRSEQYRNDVIHQQFKDRRVGYRYMFPVFFPTRPGPGHVEVFNMREYPALFESMCGLALDHCGPPPAAPEHGTADPAPGRPATPTTSPTTPKDTHASGPSTQNSAADAADCNLAAVFFEQLQSPRRLRAQIHADCFGSQQVTATLQVCVLRSIQTGWDFVKCDTVTESGSGAHIADMSVAVQHQCNGGAERDWRGWAHLALSNGTNHFSESPNIIHTSC